MIQLDSLHSILFALYATQMPTSSSLFIQSSIYNRLKTCHIIGIRKSQRKILEPN
ncbi:hypothetical protein L5515_008059 [Caenorhabditis briggsae]|uniref:Uncharacterized protein n=1 Tax=Caenorhabditis briggsae TaxID=6238 RepID=A0AAE9F8X4_CAEBR|nr:hypothetical protein L5515_008059 [Caenorhabditis briggsae]